ncbi:hypothetical protein OIDMADRAFT_133757 [Oidiodendron maius Zn]|uniref:Rhodopsin domain-containing protein n=1 Tax=Oidiodendron maius (strain Zn) TaxID=913774 RepID=A0A0C3D0U9_OIDMZ|nr:hypothetical protein OIDMADRAFT_133757 [Oidiodendron maius Zn]
MTVPIAGRGPQVNGVAGLFLALSTIAIALRCYCRAVLVKSFGIDDWFAVIAWVLFVFFCSFAITGVFHGTGQHADALPPAEIPVGLKWWWACEPVYVLSNMALKFSIGIFLLRIAVVRTHRVIIWATIAVVEIYGAFYFFLFVLQCRPSAYFWTQYTGGNGKCINPKITVDATYAYSAISCVVDWTLGIIPVFMVWNLKMNSRMKLSVALILSVGAIASTATIVRIPYVKDLANQADFLYATTDVALWSTCETGIGITASACATLRPLFRTFFSRSLTGGSTSQSNHTNPWPKPRDPSSSGYIMQNYSGKKGTDAGEFGLRADLGHSRGVTTIIESDGDKDLEFGNGDKVKWNNSASKLTEVSSDEEGKERKQAGWRVGIRKTTVSTQTAQFTQ